MEHQAESPKRKCPSCQQEKAERSFYRGVERCRACIKAEVDTPRQYNAVPLEQQAEEHRQKKLLHAELKKLAKRRMEDRKRAKIAARQRKIVGTQLVELESAVETDAATKELARRTLSRRRLIEFIKMFHPRYKAGWVHHDICQRLEKFSADVAAGKSPRLMILMPPRHGKSQIASKLYPAWHLGHYPDHEFIGCSYNIALALDFSREIRDVIASSQYAQLFPKTRLNPTFKAAESWRLDSETGVGAGGYNAAGVDGGITGKGAHILVIDDPIKNHEEADNLVHRDKVWNWYLSSAYSRLAPGGGVLVIQTWWHDDDLAGRLQTMMKDSKPDDEYVDRFEVVKYPAIAEEDEEFRMKGDALHPERYNLQQLLRIQRQNGGPTSRFWSALYQQNPVPNEGAYFTRSMIKYRDALENIENMLVYQTWDLAISEKRQSNWTVGTTIAIDHEDTVHVLEQVRFRTNDAAKIADEMLNMFARYPRVAGIGGEDGQIWRTMKATLVTRMKERKIYMSLDDDSLKLQPVTDKLVRARPLQARMQIGKVTFPRGQEWVDEFIKEAVRFPGGVQDDTIDSLAWAVVLGTRNPPPNPPKHRDRKVEKTVQELISAHARGQNGGSAMAA